MYIELQRDKRIAHENEFSDSDDEGESPSSGKRSKAEQSHKIGNKKPKLMDDPSPKNGKPSQKQGVVASPLPPEPSPITPLPTEEPTPSNSKGQYVYKWYGELYECLL